MHPPVELVPVDAPILSYRAHRLLPLLCQGSRLGFELLGIHPSFFVLFSQLLLLSYYIPRLFLYLPDGVRVQSVFVRSPKLNLWSWRVCAPITESVGRLKKHRRRPKKPRQRRFLNIQKVKKAPTNSEKVCPPTRKECPHLSLSVSKD